ncbi:MULTISPECIES: hypothetical protein [unclassified Psychrobacter]|uniref:hypothetical protein n=1 Tax=unclassified Psychrobacter TaxID=196806 RepID=UPI0025EBD502|nr:MULTISPECIES: hypothetical protein [unclassified Psychrobacter]
MSKIKKADLLQLVQEQAEMIAELSGMVELNKMSIIKLENEREKPQLKQLDQSAFKNMHERWRFAAIDADGSAHRFSKEVFPYKEGFCYEGDDYSEFKFSLIGEGYDTSNWQNSLIERDTTKELTGSELCRAMLKNQVYVPCFVSDVSEAHAIERKQTAMIDKVYSGLPFIFRSGYNGWTYVVPINNQGEPLTAAEAGL